MKTIQCAHPPHHHNGFVATCRLWTAIIYIYVMTLWTPFCCIYMCVYNICIIVLYVHKYVYIQKFIYVVCPSSILSKYFSFKPLAFLALSVIFL